MSRIIESLKSAIRFAKGDKSAGKVTSVPVYQCMTCKTRPMDNLVTGVCADCAKPEIVPFRKVK